MRKRAIKMKIKRAEVIQCEKVKGGFIFEVSEGQFIPGDRRVVRDPADAITIFVGLIHGQKLNEITAHEEEKDKKVAASQGNPGDVGY